MPRHRPAAALAAGRRPGASIHEHFARADRYTTTGFRKHVGVVVSHDGGDLAVDGHRAYLAWTHAPGPPSRVMTTYFDVP